MLLQLTRSNQEDELARFFLEICSTVRTFNRQNVLQIKRILTTAIQEAEEQELTVQKGRLQTDLVSTPPPTEEDCEESDFDDDVFD